MRQRGWERVYWAGQGHSYSAYEQACSSAVEAAKSHCGVAEAPKWGSNEDYEARVKAAWAPKR